MNFTNNIPKQLKEIIDRGFSDSVSCHNLDSENLRYIDKRSAVVKTLLKKNLLSKTFPYSAEKELNIGFCFDGSFLPIRNGASYTILNLMRSLYDSNNIYPNLVLCYRGWDDPSLYYKKCFRTLFINPFDYYGQTNVIEQIFKKFKIKIVHFYSSEGLLNLGSRLKKIGIKVIFEIQNIDHILYSRLGSDKTEINRVKKLQKKAIKISDFVFCRSAIDYNQALNLGADPRNTAIYKGGIYVNDFIFKTRNQKRYKLVFLGHMYYPPNENALKNIATIILPDLDNRYSITILGITPRKTIEKYKNPRLTFKEGVDDLSKELLNYDIALAPLSEGSGTRLKILDYLASGLPVITTSLGIEGLDNKIAHLVTVEDDLRLYAQRINFIMNNINSYDEQASIAREFVKSEYDWSRCINTFLKVYEQLL